MLAKEYYLAGKTILYYSNEYNLKHLRRILSGIEILPNNKFLYFNCFDNLVSYKTDTLDNIVIIIDDPFIRIEDMRIVSNMKSKNNIIVVSIQLNSYVNINKFHIVTNKQANYNIDDYVKIMERVDIYSTNDRILQLSDGSLKEINLNFGSL